MSMFSNYLDTNYIPNNIKPAEPELYISEDFNLPYKMYDIKNNLVGLCWSSQDKFQLKISIEKVIYVEPEALIFTSIGRAPSLTATDKVGLKAYNTAETKSWTCVKAGDRLFWSEDSTFQYPKAGLVPYTFSFNMSGKDLVVDICNFKYDVLKSDRFMDSNNGNITIGTDAFTLKEGIYYINCYIDDLGTKQLIDTKTISVGRYDENDFQQVIRKDDVSYKTIIYDGTNVSSNQQTDVIYNGGSLSSNSQPLRVIYDGGRL